MRRKNGFIDVNKMLQDIGVYETATSDLKNNSKIIDISMYMSQDITFGFDYNGTTYFYKYDEEIIPYNELVAEELAKDFGLSCIDYDLAILNDKKGVISKNYQKDNVSYINGEDIIIDYYECKGLDIDKYNNLEAIWDALEYRYKDFPNRKEIVANLMKKIVDIFIFDIITSQRDRHLENWQIIESEKDIDIAPLFDNERILVSEAENIFLLLTIEEKISGNLFENLEVFLNVSSADYRNIIKEKMWIISDENLQSVFKRIENKTEYPMPQSEKEYYLRKYQNHRKQLQQVLENNENIRKR